MATTPKELQTAYQRWEMNSFGDERPSVVAKRPPPIELPSEETVAGIREEARLIGYEEGHASGYADGLAIGRAEAARELEHLASIAVIFGTAVAEADEVIANDVLELALHLAKGMLRNALEVKPELLIPVVREAIEYLPVLQQPALLLLNPADAALVRQGIGEELEKGGWRVVEDSQIGRGGCKIDTASNQIDAQTASRWQRLTAALGKNVDWLGP
ncbi:MAG: flagellar assembly protein FliH [Pseudomonadota bacterium]